LLSKEFSQFTFASVTTIIHDIHYVKPLIMLMKFLGQARGRPRGSCGGNILVTLM